MIDKGAKWKMEVDEDFFRIYDKHKDIVGYFDPDYGELHPKGMESDIIEKMIKNHAVVSSGYLTLPFVKFGIFDVTDFTSTIYQLEGQVSYILSKITRWKQLIDATNTLQSHVISVSHTNLDMLSITFNIKFQEPTPLESTKLISNLSPILYLFQEHDLL